MPQVIIKWLGPARDWSGLVQERIDLQNGSTVSELLRNLALRYPKMGEAGGVRLAVNRAYVTLEHVLKDGDEVAVIPPVSGG